MISSNNYVLYRLKFPPWWAPLRCVSLISNDCDVHTEPCLKSQQDQIDHIQQRLSPLSSVLDEVAAIEAELIESNIEENDYTVFTHSDLDFELKLVQQTVVKKIKFIDNQVRALASSLLVLVLSWADGSGE